MKRILLFAAAAGLLGTLGFQHDRARRLRAENAVLAVSANEARTLQSEAAEHSADPLPGNIADEIARLREANRDLLKLRGEIGRLRDLQAQFEEVRAENERLRSLQQSSRERPESGIVPPVTIHFRQLSNQGQLTPEATLQTFFLAWREGDVAAFINCLTLRRFSPAARMAGNHEDAQRLAQDFRQDFTQTFSPDATLAIAARRDVGDNTVQLGIEIRNRSDRPGRKIAVTVQRIGMEWKLDVNPDDF